MSKKMTPAAKKAFVERMNKAKGVKPTAPKQKKEPSRMATDQELETIANGGKKPAPRKQSSLPDPDPEGKYPKVEVGKWGQNKKKLDKLVSTAFEQKHGKHMHGEERAVHNEGDKNKNRIESAKAEHPNLT